MLTCKELRRLIKEKEMNLDDYVLLHNGGGWDYSNERYLVGINKKYKNSKHIISWSEECKDRYVIGLKTESVFKRSKKKPMTLRQLLEILPNDDMYIVEIINKPKNYWKAHHILNIFNGDYDLRNKEVRRRFGERTVNIIF